MTHPSDYDDRPVDPTIDPELAPPEPIEKESVRVREDRRVVGQLIEPEVDETPPEPVLTNEERRDLSMLMTVGRREKKINVKGHQVTVQTLKTGDEMRIGLFTKPYLDTQGFSRAYQIGVCAAGIRDIKGQELWDALDRKPLMEIDDPEEIFAKNTEALQKFYPTTIVEIYQAIMDLEREFAELALKLGK